MRWCWNGTWLDAEDPRCVRYVSTARRGVLAEVVRCPVKAREVVRNSNTRGILGGIVLWIWNSWDCGGICWRYPGCVPVGGLCKFVWLEMWLEMWLMFESM